MKLRLLVIPAIVATSAALGASGSAHSEPGDAQAYAAALLSRPYVPGSLELRERSSTAVIDAHANAAALLSGQSSDHEAKASVRIASSTVARASLDTHAQAAALLRGSRNAPGENSRISKRITQTVAPLGEHPAVLVAHTWSARGIDPNTFIVAHPARLQLLAVSPADSDPQSTHSVTALIGHPSL